MTAPCKLGDKTRRPKSYLCHGVAFLRRRCLVFVEPLALLSWLHYRLSPHFQPFW